MSAHANAASRLGKLFGDPLEGLDTDEVGYRGPVACSAAGITYRQLDYWARTGLLQPSIRAARSRSKPSRIHAPGGDPIFFRNAPSVAGRR